MTDPTRRRILRQGAGALAAACGLGAFVSLRFATPWPSERTADAVVIGFPEDIPADGLLLLPSAQIAVGRTEQGFYALKTICPHLGCVVRWLDAEDLFHCPCHGSRFERDGHVLNGPAREDLVPVPLGVDGQGRLVVDPSGEIA